MTPAGARFSFLAHVIDATFLAAVGLIYLLTLYPLLWWGDGPELVTAAWTDGVAHPSGYPVYLVLLKAFLLIPLGSIAWRANLFSAFASLVGFACLLRLVPFDARNLWRAIGWRIGLAFLALSPLLWESSTLSEVYSLSFAFFGAILWTAKKWEANPTKAGLLLLGLLVGLATGHHRLLALMLPGLALWLAPVFSSGRAKWTWFGLSIPVFLLTLATPYLLVYLRAKGSPPLNWEDPSTFGGLWNLFSASQFRVDQKIVNLQEWALFSRNVGPSPWGISLGILLSLPSLWWDNLKIGLPLGMIGLIQLFRRSPRVFWAGLVAWLIPTLFLAQYHVADIDQFFLFPYFLVGLSCAVGCGSLLEWTSIKNTVAALGVAVFLLGSIAVTLTSSGRPSPSITEIPERYARQTLEAVSPGSILLAQPAEEGEAGDYVYYPLLYMKEVARRGTDSALVSTSFMSSPWYRSTLEREGLHTAYFEDLVNGTSRIPVVDFELNSYFAGNKGLGDARKGEGTSEYRFYRFGNRLIGHGYKSFLARLGESFFPHIKDRPLYVTDEWKELEPFLDRNIEWTEVLHVPILTRGVPSLDGKPLPTGKLYRVEIEDR